MKDKYHVRLRVSTYEGAVKWCNQKSKHRREYLTLTHVVDDLYIVSNKCDPKYLKGLENDKFNNRFGIKSGVLSVYDAGINAGVSRLKEYKDGKTPYWINLYYCIPIGMDQGYVITDRTDHTSEYYARNDIRKSSTITYLKTVKIWR